MIKLQRICTCGATIDERTIDEEDKLREQGLHTVHPWLIVRMNHMKCKSCLEKLLS